MRGDEATADVIVVWCLCCCGLCLYARTHNVCLLWEEEGYTLRGTAAGYTGRDLATLSQRQRRLQQTNATSRIIQRGYTAPPALCAGSPSAASIALASELQKRSRSLLPREHHSSRRHTSHVSTAALSRHLPHQSPSAILKQSSSNSNLIGLTLLLVKAVIGPLSKCPDV